MGICIIGAGVTGLLLILLLQNRVPLHTITIVDPHFDGGDLMRKWSNVISNTPWKLTRNAILRCLPNIVLPEWTGKFDLEKPTPLIHSIRLIHEVAMPYLLKTCRIKGSVHSANWNSNIGKWDIDIKTAPGNSHKTISSSVLILATGGEPKFLDLGIPSIPLDIALDSKRLDLYVRPGQRVAVFGLRHSGVLILNNLLQTNAVSVIGVYNGEVPFSFSDEGDYDGLKLDGASIARSYLLAKPDCLTLLPCKDVIASNLDVDWVVYSIGFERRSEFLFCINGVPASLERYNGYTGRLIEAPNAWGFGLAYPSQAPDGVHWDVGILSFMEHINKQIDSIASISL
jgi:hypothetical protein